MYINNNLYFGVSKDSKFFFAFAFKMLIYLQFLDFSHLKTSVDACYVILHKFSFIIST